MFKLSFATDNAAFNEDTRSRAYEVSRILDAVNEAVRHAETHGRIRDCNGNHVGDWSLTSSDTAEV